MSSDFKTELQAIVDKVEPVSRAHLQRTIDSILQNGADSYDAWLALLQSRDESTDVRATVCWALARFQDERVLPSLLEALKNSDAVLRGEAARALGTLGSPQAFEPLLKAAHEDANVEVRQAAIYALNLLGDERAVEPLIALLTDRKEDEKVRGMAAEALAHQMDRRAISPLIDALRDASVEVRFWAAFALGELGDPQALPELERLAATDEAVLPGWWSVSKEAASAIQRIKDDRPYQ